MFDRIETLPRLLLMGKSLRMSMRRNRTAELWASLMPQLPQIKGIASEDKYSVQVYDPGTSFATMTPEIEFTKWAAVPANEGTELAEGMEFHRLAGGTYAVFIHRGLPQAFPRTLGFIFGEWLPQSGYVIDEREQFEVLPPGYRPDDPQAQEEVWVPVRKRSQ